MFFCSLIKMTLFLVLVLEMGSASTDFHFATSLEDWATINFTPPELSKRFSLHEKPYMSRDSRGKHGNLIRGEKRRKLPRLGRGVFLEVTFFSLWGGKIKKKEKNNVP